MLPNKAREFAKYEGILTKTDDMDAYTLGMLGCLDKRLKPWTPPSPIYRELRQMTRFVADINKVKTELRNHLEALTHSEIAEKSIAKHYNKLIDEIDKQLDSNQKAIREKIKQEPGLSERIDRITAIMRKLLLLIYSLWKSGEKYDLTRGEPVCNRQKKEAETAEGEPVRQHP